MALIIIINLSIIIIIIYRHHRHDHHDHHHHQYKPGPGERTAEEKWPVEVLKVLDKRHGCKDHMYHHHQDIHHIHHRHIIPIIIFAMFIIVLFTHHDHNLPAQRLVHASVSSYPEQ